MRHLERSLLMSMLPMSAFSLGQRMSSPRNVLPFFTSFEKIVEDKATCKE